MVIIVTITSIITCEADKEQLMNKNFVRLTPDRQVRTDGGDGRPKRSSVTAGDEK